MNPSLPPAPIGRRIVPLAAAVLLPLASITLIGWLALGWVTLTGIRWAFVDDELETAIATLTTRVADAEPIIDELHQLGVDVTELRRADAAFVGATTPIDQGLAALGFVEAVQRLAAEVPRSDRHEARLVRQRVDRLREGKQAFLGAWSDCQSFSERWAGRWALTLRIVEPACRR